MIAETREAEGWLTSPNQVTYTSAFAGVQADLRYTSSRAGLEQDVILREAPPGPEQFNLNPATTRLEVWTEFTDVPEPKLKKRQRPETQPGQPVVQIAEADEEDEEIDFTAMKIGEGRAFSLGDEARPDNILVKKRWLKTAEGRVFLIEAVDMPVIKAELDQLPKGGAGLSRPANAGVRGCRRC